MKRFEEVVYEKQQKLFEKSKRIKAEVIFLLCLFILVFSSCSSETPEETRARIKSSLTTKDNNSSPRLIIVESGQGYRIYVDRNTKVMYVKTNSSFTPMIDEGGKPLRYSVR